MKIYTKTGDEGTTSLIGGERVSKASPRVEAYGTVDELAAHLALLADMMAGEPQARFAGIVAWIEEIQKDLMAVEAVLATGKGGEDKVKPLSVSAVERLEDQIDEMTAGLPPVKGFVIPGGHLVVSQTHVCRTVCRRAERAIVRAGEIYPLPRGPLEYMNRLSDWLYEAGRRVAFVLSVEDKYWLP